MTYRDNPDIICNRCIGYNKYSNESEKISRIGRINMLLKLCARCQKVIQAPNRYCTNCEKIVEEEIEKNKQRSMSRYNKNRDKKYKAFYNSKEWKLLRDTYKEKHYLCEICQEESEKDNKYSIQLTEEVHHKEPIQTPTGWLRRYEWNNLIALCHKHHDMQHNRFKRRNI